MPKQRQAYKIDGELVKILLVHSEKGLHYYSQQFYIPITLGAATEF